MSVECQLRSKVNVGNWLPLLLKVQFSHRHVIALPTSARTDPQTEHTNASGPFSVVQAGQVFILVGTEAILH
mgnify:CR=1 FL=1